MPVSMGFLFYQLLHFLFISKISTWIIGLRGLGLPTQTPGLAGGGGEGLGSSPPLGFGCEEVCPSGLLSPFGQTSGPEPGPVPAPASPGLAGLGPAGGEWPEGDLQPQDHSSGTWDWSQSLSLRLWHVLPQCPSQRWQNGCAQACGPPDVWSSVATPQPQSVWGTAGG